ncbi:MAG: 2-hydroxyglutaryl-CoA dehydratase [Proteobacteria bacterium]|nr:2-hydroxyglutaryl-CoA dehydratase [Pseudomonadota bacterium]MBU1582802.1 2-hydroxyglutaryl-CoA dehydratase [Pseudomonadota bacterium]MBU2455991.1 2-hydroxyglutaryl-CoA dehydratase [Pseudomonadota bacterium]MBU2628048.1 2-hydroxyglutaryl-CoA dehydratase [Pseudomonadota bacterium]
MYFLGIDIGSLSCDAVLIDEQKRIVSSSVILTGAKNIEAIARVKKNVLSASGLMEKDIRSIISTGYGRARVKERDGAVTEITCHAKGIKQVIPETRILIDIGGQDSKAICLDVEGNVVDFAMNDKCAAGTGRFLEAMARALEVDIDQLGDLDSGATSNLVLSSMCTVFAESEVVSLIAGGTEQKEIAKGLHRAIAARTHSLVKRVSKSIDGLVVSMSGGVARNKGVVRAVAESMNIKKVNTPENPDIIGALGAAIIALERSA